MLTMEDCLGFTDLSADEVAEIAAHERMAFTAALEKGVTLLENPWGDAAIRQIVWDNLCTAHRRSHAMRTEELSVLYHGTCARHPNPCDRRRSPVRPKHPLPPH